MEDVGRTSTGNKGIKMGNSLDHVFLKSRNAAIVMVGPKAAPSPHGPTGDLEVVCEKT